jgi:MFS family permease
MDKKIKRNILACYISDSILGTYFQLPIWIVYQSKFLDFSQIAFFSGLSLITEVLAQLPTGAFADIFDRKYALSLGNLFMALPMFLMAFYPTGAIMWAYAIMWGIGRAFCMGTSKPIVYESLLAIGHAQLYSKILSRSVLYFQLSTALSIVLGGYLYQITPNLPYIISGLASLVGVFTAFIFVEVHTSKQIHTLGNFISTAKSGFIEIFKNSYITKLTLLYALTMGIATILETKEIFQKLRLVLPRPMLSWLGRMVK